MIMKMISLGSQQLWNVCWGAALLRFDALIRCILQRQVSEVNGSRSEVTWQTGDEGFTGSYAQAGRCTALRCTRVHLSGRQTQMQAVVRLTWSLRGIC
jgi:hypothetical protein